MKVVVIIFILVLVSGCGGGSGDYRPYDYGLNSYERNSYSGYMSGGCSH